MGSNLEFDLLKVDSLHMSLAHETVFNLLQSMPSLPLSESIVSQYPTTHLQYILHHILFCPYTCNECSTSQSYPSVITF